MIPRIGAVLALVGLAAACVVYAALRFGGDERATPVTPPAPRAEPKMAALPEPPPRRQRGTRVYVSVVDGDRSRVVRRAVVRIGRQADRVGPRGIATLRVPRPAPLPVTAWAPGYAKRTVRLPFQRRRWLPIRIYRAADQWPMYGANPARTQAHAEIALRPPFRVVWSRGIGSLIEFPAVVSDGVAYIANFRGIVRAISMRSGKVAWRRDTPNGKMAASPAVVGDELVVHGMDGHVWVLDRANGRVLWRYRVGSPIESSPVVRRGVDYFGAWNGNVYALDLRRRRVRWVYRSGYKITSSAALAGGKVFIGDYGGRLLALSMTTGRPRWISSVDGRVYGTPAVAGGRVFVPSSTGNSLTAFSAGGRYLWRVETGGYVYSSPAVWAGRVYFGSYDGRLYAVSARTGSVLWTVGTGGPVSGAPVVVAGVVYAGSTFGRITGALASSGRVLLRFPHGEYVPVSGNAGRLLFHGYSRLYAVESRR